MNSLGVSTVARTVEPGLQLDADIAGEPLIRAMQRTPASEYLLRERDGDLDSLQLTAGQRGQTALGELRDPRASHRPLDGGVVGPRRALER